MSPSVAITCNSQRDDEKRWESELLPWAIRRVPLMIYLDETSAGEAPCVTEAFEASTIRSSTCCQ